MLFESTGVNPKDDVLAALGDVWTVYASPSDGSFPWPGAVASQSVPGAAPQWWAATTTFNRRRREVLTQIIEKPLKLVLLVCLSSIICGPILAVSPTPGLGRGRGYGLGGRDNAILILFAAHHELHRKQVFT